MSTVCCPYFPRKPDETEDSKIIRVQYMLSPLHCLMYPWCINYLRGHTRYSLRWFTYPGSKTPPSRAGCFTCDLLISPPSGVITLATSRNVIGIKNVGVENNGTCKCIRRERCLHIFVIYSFGETSKKARIQWKCP